jgi:hypothetical protein
MVAGDFNGNVIWDRASSRRASFRKVADFLAERELLSADHSRTGETFGTEPKNPRSTCTGRRNASITSTISSFRGHSKSGSPPSPSDQQIRG